MSDKPLTPKQRLVLSMAMHSESIDPVQQITIENGVYRALRIRGLLEPTSGGRLRITEEGRAEL
jgi:hypothetical protein